MLIGIDASRANRKHKTGTEWYSYYLIRWLSKLDSKNQYVLYSDSPLTAGLLDLGTEQYIAGQGYEKIEFDKEGFQKIRSPYNNFKAKILNWPFGFFWTQGRLSLEMLFRQPDLLFVPAHTLPIIHPKHTIITIHDIAFEKEGSLYQEEQIKTENKSYNFLIQILAFIFTFGKYRANNMDYLRWSTKFGLDHAEKVITVSNYSKNDLVNYYKADSNKISVVYNGYNKLIFRKIDDKTEISKVLEKYGISRPFILYVGRIEKKKNIPKLIEAFSIVKQSGKLAGNKLVLVGKASFGFDETNYSIQEFGLANDVIITGWVEEADLPFLFNAATAFVFPSNYEGFGIPLLQAMACGTPIVTSCSTSIPEIVGDAAFLFNPLSANSIAEGIAKIINSEELRSKLIDEGRKRIQNFSWMKCAEDTLEQINKIK